MKGTPNPAKRVCEIFFASASCVASTPAAPSDYQRLALSRALFAVRPELDNDCKANDFDDPALLCFYFARLRACTATHTDALWRPRLSSFLVPKRHVSSTLTPSGLVVCSHHISQGVFHFLISMGLLSYFSCLQRSTSGHSTVKDRCRNYRIPVRICVRFPLGWLLLPDPVVRLQCSNCYCDALDVGLVAALARLRIVQTPVFNLALLIFAW